MIIVYKDDWPWDELVDIGKNSTYFNSNMLWMLPNMHKIMTEKEAKKVCQYLCNLYSLDFDSEFLDKGEWETIGCKCSDKEEITWTNPTPKTADFVVLNLKNVCSNLEIELEEM